ncbi:ABC-type transporter, integral membrane subunit [Tepidanaerobacter acetatoxydans Re1]|uniref:ABC-type transporter, integral membrane subunit n=1 Tax=Tepidanaerobacter acetatoxydans (strain DSM 21804 / JCM 16047 / Re1) TaxID=1209989 RepID=F4LXL3_TEPAE|nr:branched-chain amino acid ABC transporter permease [Tepidanaerobacter acetatoxydans]AEE91942.1 ABC-type transporter, integral membrane subunit [Tepidanaerobacter acetatoxydans Re1]CCP26769.1 ABC-type transporter, integral membrane subunit [Tepidanaerobacter acetatoxydans Re1]
MKKPKIILLIILAVILVALPVIDKNAYHHMLLNQTLINIIVVMGLNFITGLTGQMNLGTAGIYAMGAYSSALLSIKLGVSAWLGIAFALLIGYIIGHALGYPSLRVKGVYLSLTTIGFSEIVRLILTNWANFTGGAQGLQNIPCISLFGFKFDNAFKIYYLYLFITVLLCITAKRLVASKWGRAFKSIKDSAEAAEACGINIADIKIKAFTLATLYGCLGGAMYAHLIGYINPMGFTQDISINYLVMLMIGGIGSVEGNIIGAITVTILPELLRFLKDYYWLIFSVITLIFAILLPNGIITLIKPLERVKLPITYNLKPKKGGR